MKGKYFRQFPDLDNDGSSSQLATYNLNCLQQDFIDVQHELEELNLQVRREIDEFPSDVEKTGAKEAQRQLDKINIDISNLSDKNVPKTLLHIIQEAQKAINNIARGDPKVDAPKHLLTELGLFFGPGKTDCHKMQFNLNNAIKY